MNWKRVKSDCFHLGPLVNSALGHLGRVNSACFYLANCDAVLVLYM